jgi:hypothetical protein
MHTLRRSCAAEVVPVDEQPPHPTQRHLAVRRAAITAGRSGAVGDPRREFLRAAEVF